jgi:hypothetical protein
LSVDEASVYELDEDIEAGLGSAASAPLAALEDLVSSNDVEAYQDSEAKDDEAHQDSEASWSDPDRPNRLERSSVIPSVVIDRLRELERFKLTQEDAIMQATLLELGRNGGCVSCKP